MAESGMWISCCCRWYSTGGRFTREVKAADKGIFRVYERRKLRVNVSRSEVMTCIRMEGDRIMNVALNGKLLEEVELFKYLGSYIREWQRDKWRCEILNEQNRKDVWRNEEIVLSVNNFECKILKQQWYMQHCTGLKLGIWEQQKKNLIQGSWSVWELEKYVDCGVTLMNQVRNEMWERERENCGCQRVGWLNRAGCIEVVWPRRENGRKENNKI